MQLVHSGRVPGPLKTNVSTTFWDRLKKASEYANVSCRPIDVAKELDINPAAVTKYVNGGYPKRDNVNKLARTRGVASEWLFSGTGPMITERELDTDTLELMKLWRNLPQDARERLLVNVRYEHTAAQTITTGKRVVLTEELIRLIQSASKGETQ